MALVETMFIIPGKPVGKERPRFGQHYARTPDKTKLAAHQTASVAREVWGDRPLLQGGIRIDVEANFEVPQSWSSRDTLRALAGEICCTEKPDEDNIKKLLYDAFNSVLWVDDKQVCESHFVKQYSEKACIIVKVQPLEAIDERQS